MAAVQFEHVVERRPNGFGAVTDLDREMAELLVVVGPTGCSTSTTNPKPERVSPRSTRACSTASATTPFTSAEGTRSIGASTDATSPCSTGRPARSSATDALTYPSAT
jgi:hypothetical protein